MEERHRELVGAAIGATVGGIAGGHVGGMIGEAVGAAAGALLVSNVVSEPLEPLVHLSGEEMAQMGFELDDKKKVFAGGAIGAAGGALAGGPLGAMVGAAMGVAAGAFMKDKKAPTPAATTPYYDVASPQSKGLPSEPSSANQKGGGGGTPYPVPSSITTPYPVPSSITTPSAPSVVSATTPAGTTVTDPNSGTVVSVPKANEPAKATTGFKLPASFTLPKGPPAPTSVAPSRNAPHETEFAPIPAPRFSFAKPGATYQAPTLGSKSPTMVGVTPAMVGTAAKPSVVIRAPHGEFGIEGAKCYKTFSKRRTAKAAASNVGWEFGKIELPFGTTFVTEGDAYSYLDSTNGQVGAINNDISFARNKLPADLMNSWAFFKADWDKFYAQGRSESHNLDAADWMDRTDPYVAKLKQFQTQIQRHGVGKNVPGVFTDEDSTFNADGTPKIPGLSTLQVMGLGAGAALVGLIGLKLL